MAEKRLAGRNNGRSARRSYARRGRRRRTFELSFCRFEGAASRADNDAVSATQLTTASNEVRMMLFMGQLEGMVGVL